jgi:hypothetical protein
MRAKLTLDHPRRTRPTFRLVAGPRVRVPQVGRPPAVFRTVPRNITPQGLIGAAQDGSPLDTNFDYGRVLTPEGGILITYKDIDPRLRHTLWRALAWIAFTAFEAWLLFERLRLESTWMAAACLAVAATVNFFVVRKPPELYRTIEIRPDCLILEGSEVFWLRNMPCGWPTFEPDEDGNQILCGVYGTRLVEYLTARRFDEYDRSPEVLAAHLQEAMEQLWGSAVAFGKAQPGSPRRNGR